VGRAARLVIPAVAGVLAAAATYAVLDDGGTEPRATTATAASSATTTAADTDGRAVFVRLGCGSCHRLSAARSQGDMGPDLDVALAAHTAESLRAKIVDPYPGEATPGAMPKDFGARLSAAELDALVAFLLASR
jgi:cytochrome c553